MKKFLLILALILEIIFFIVLCPTLFILTIMGYYLFIEDAIREGYTIAQQIESKITFGLYIIAFILALVIVFFSIIAIIKLLKKIPLILFDKIVLWLNIPLILIILFIIYH